MLFMTRRLPAPRDVCPPNYVVAPDAQSLKLIDFGLTLPATPQFMQPGNRTGKPNYMAPEIVKRQSTDVRVDVFAFGVTAYELCTFELPWEQTRRRWHGGPGSRR